MSFKIKLFLAFLLIAIAISNCETTNGKDSVRAEYHNKTESCWKHGTYEVRGHSPGEYVGSVKIAKRNGKYTVFNFGSEYHFEGDISVKDNVKTVLDNTPGKAAGYLSIENGERKFVKKYEGMKKYCQLILSYKCLDDVIVSNSESLIENQLNCTTLYGDLIINGMSRNGNDTEPDPRFLEFLNKLERIEGRLVIDGVHYDKPITFSKLSKVGEHKTEDESLLPSIVIKGNTFQEIDFPLIQPEECDQNIPGNGMNQKTNCIRIEKNSNNSETENRSLDIKFENGKISDGINDDFTSSNIQLKAISSKEKKKIETDYDLKKKTDEFIEIDWDNESMRGYHEIYLTLGIIGFVAIIGGIVFQIIQCRKLPKIDYKALELGDEKSTKELNEEYNKVQERKNMNRNSGMDDLGSL